jgi:hypothetical protein
MHWTCSEIRIFPCDKHKSASGLRNPVAIISPLVIVHVRSVAYFEPDRPCRTGGMRIGYSVMFRFAEGCDTAAEVPDLTEGAQRRAQDQHASGSNRQQTKLEQQSGL